MKPINIALQQAMTSPFQNGKDFRRPSAAVIIEKPPGADDFLVTDSWLPDIISIEVDTDIESPGKTFTITCSNENGLMSPDYRYNKYGTVRLFHEIPIPSPWRNVLLPETKLSIHLGYLGNYMRMMTGTIDNVSIDSQGRTIKITGRSMYKKAITDTLRPKGSYVIEDKNMNVADAVKELLKNVGLESVVFPLKEPGSNDPFIVTKKIGQRREHPADLITSMVDSTFTVLIEDQLGVIRMKNVPVFDRKSKAVYAFDDSVEIQESDFEIDDSEIFNAILVKCGKEADRFTSSSIYRNIFHNDSYREMEVEIPWADTYEKRRYVAKSLFNQMAMRWRKLSLTVPAVLPLELLDVVLARERVSQVNWNLHIRGIKYTYTSSGLFQTLELADNTGFLVSNPEHLPPPPPPPPSDLPPFTVTDSKISIDVWDFSVEDGDRLNIYFNGVRLKRHVFIRNKPFTLNLPLRKGSNVLKFVGVSAGTLSTLSGRFRVHKQDGSILYDAGSLPDLEMPRTNLISQKTGFYDPDKRPVKTWVINRI